MSAHAIFSFTTPTTKARLREQHDKAVAYAQQAVTKAEQAESVAQQMYARAHYINTLCIQLVKTMDPEGVVIIPAAELVPAHVGDVLEVQTLENGDLRLGVSNATLADPDMQAQIADFQKELADGTRTIEPAAGNDSLVGDAAGAPAGVAAEDEGVRGERRTGEVAGS